MTVLHAQLNDIWQMTVCLPNAATRYTKSRCKRYFLTCRTTRCGGSSRRRRATASPAKWGCVTWGRGVTARYGTSTTPTGANRAVPGPWATSSASWRRCSPSTSTPWARYRRDTTRIPPSWFTVRRASAGRVSPYCAICCFIPSTTIRWALEQKNSVTVECSDGCQTACYWLVNFVFFFRKCVFREWWAFSVTRGPTWCRR